MLMETNDLSQYVTKILINSAFGSLSMEINSFSHGQGFSAAITTGGRFANRWANHKLSNFLAKANGTQNVTGYDYSKQCDTDSVVGDTLIYVNGDQITIKEYYESLCDDNFIKKDDFNGFYIKRVSGDLGLSCSKNMEVQNKHILHVMKHKVNKGIYRIKVDGKEVKITEDHSIIVLRDGKMISVKPNEIQKTDKLITL